MNITVYLGANEGNALGIQLLPLGRVLTGCRKEGYKPGD